MNSNLRSQQKKFERRQLALSIGGLAILLLFSVVFARIYFSGHANSTAKIVGQILRVRDFRLMLDILEQSRLEHFNLIQFNSPDDGLSFTLPEAAAILPHKSPLKALMSDEIQVESLSANGSGGKSSLTFEYDRFVFVPYAVFAWIFLCAISLLPAAVIRKRFIAQFETDLKIRLESEVREKKLEIAELVSHDIRSPLSALNMVLAAHGEFSDEKREVAKKAVRRINDIANNLLRPDKPALFKNNSLGSDVDPLFLKLVIESIIQEKKIQYSNRPDILLKLNFNESENVRVFAREDELSRVLSNLLNNSFEAILAAGVITIDVLPTEESVTVKIHDTGRGIPPELLTQIGKKGFSHGEKVGESGSGLGVYQASQVLKKSGGSLTFESEVGVGSTVKLTIRRAPTDSRS